MSTFEDIINKWVEETQARIDNVLQTIIIRIGTQLITLSPIDTGHFKGNWQLSFDGNTYEIDRKDTTGSVTLQSLSLKANSFTAGQVAYIQNHVEYGYDLEYGSSRQAPSGVVRITTSEAMFRSIVADAIALHAE